MLNLFCTNSHSPNWFPKILFLTILHHILQTSLNKKNIENPHENFLSFVGFQLNCGNISFSFFYSTSTEKTTNTSMIDLSYSISIMINCCTETKQFLTWNKKWVICKKKRYENEIHDIAIISLLLLKIHINLVLYFAVFGFEKLLFCWI
jgi:hypothetical protein